jgi:hypothetical protein
LAAGWLWCHNSIITWTRLSTIRMWWWCQCWKRIWQLCW